MVAELGETADPRELIPGEPEQIANDLRRLVANMNKIGATGDGLRPIDPGHWTGDGADAFRELFAEEPPKWFQVVEALGQGGKSLADYGDVLVWAQTEAQRAIELHTQAQAASRAAAAQYDALSRVVGRILAPFQDPGEKLAQDAQAVLDNARERVAAAGDLAARALGFEPDGEGGYSKKIGEGKEFGAAERKTPDWDEKEQKWVDKGGRQSGKGGKSYRREWGDQSKGMLTDTVGETLKALGFDLHERTWAASVGVELSGGSIEGQFESGPFSGSGKLAGSVLGADASASATVNDLGVTAAASAEAYLAKGTADGEVKLGEHAGVSGHAEGIVGAEASAKGSLGLAGGQGSAEAFVGAKIAGDASAEVAGVSAGVHAEAWAGAGVEASGQVGLGDDGEFHLGVSLGVGLGIGGELGFDVAIDPAEVVDTVRDVADDVGEIASDVGHGIANAAESIGDFLGF